MKHCKEKGNWSAKLPEKLTKKDVDGKLPAQPLHDTKHTKTDTGSNKFGSFSDEGIDVFGDLFQQVQEARSNAEEMKRIADFEEAFLKKFKPAANPNEQPVAASKNKKNKKAGDGRNGDQEPAAKKGKKNVMDWD